MHNNSAVTVSELPRLLTFCTTLATYFYENLLVIVCPQALVREIGEGAFSGTLARDSSNILELVRDSYNVRSMHIFYSNDPLPDQYGYRVVHQKVNFVLSGKGSPVKTTTINSVLSLGACIQVYMNSSFLKCRHLSNMDIFMHQVQFPEMRPPC